MPLIVLTLRQIIFPISGTFPRVKTYGARRKKTIPDFRIVRPPAAAWPTVNPLFTLLEER
jgi:hypothetical protein